MPKPRTHRPPQKMKPLSPRQSNALQMTLDGFTKGEIQERLGIAQATLWRWRQLPAWDEQIGLVLRGSSTDGQGQIKSMLPLATRRLKQLIHSPTETVALGACRTVLEAHANLVAREEQQQMLQALEEQVSELRDAARERRLPESVIDAVEVEFNPDTHEATEPVQSCAPVITADTQAAATPSADAGSLIATGAAPGQIGHVGHDSDPGLDKDAAQGALF